MYNLISALHSQLSDSSILFAAHYIAINALLTLLKQRFNKMIIGVLTDIYYDTYLPQC